MNVLESITHFVGEDNLNGSAWTSMKGQLSNHLAVVQGLICATDVRNFSKVGGKNIKMIDIDRLYKQRSLAYEQKEDCENKKAYMKDRIERLKAAKAKVSTIKLQVPELRMKASWLQAPQLWEGDKCAQYQEVVRDELLAGFSTYYNHTDDVLDAINNEITRLQNESREIDGVIGSLLNSISYIGTAIENFFN